MNDDPANARCIGVWQPSGWNVSPRRATQAALVGALFVLGSVALAQSSSGQTPLTFRDRSRETGITPILAGIRGHGAGWGDVDGDGRFDLYVGTFHTLGTKPGQLLRNRAGKFELDPEPVLQISARATGVVFADLDNDGDVDLYVASMPKPAMPRNDTKKPGDGPLAGCSLFRNEGAGRFVNVSEGNGACPAAFGGRSAAVLDYDGDGQLDLLVGEDPHPGYNGSPTASSRLFRNRGELQFEDVSQAAGLGSVPGLGVAAADVNLDGWPDLFLAASDGGNRLYLNDGRGSFRELPNTVFAWPDAKGDNMCCGVAWGDVNRDGWPDLVLGQHYERPWARPVANRLYLHRGLRDGLPVFEDVTDAAGLVGLPMKAPHVELQDFDNDGWLEISTSLVMFAATGEPHPVIFQQTRRRDGVPQFAAPALQVNDFPTPEDLAVRRTGEFFDKLVRDRKVIYTAPGPVADYDNDGRLDMFLGSWWVEAPSMLLRNESQVGNWLQLELKSLDPALNRQGIGARISVYRAGGAEPQDLLGTRELAVGFGYASGQPALAHFGLGDVTDVDIVVHLPHGRGSVRRPGLAANQRYLLQIEARPPN